MNVRFGLAGANGQLVNKNAAEMTKEDFAQVRAVNVFADSHSEAAIAQQRAVELKDALGLQGEVQQKMTRRGNIFYSVSNRQSMTDSQFTDLIAAAKEARK